ncbi:hypothetical protein J2Y48_003293 [Mycoplana sp. BE70]|uniref:hypothetical protein n=1 Tax=Mycoplana sp. BE70 TaxID=2817775 RepID=UPI002863A607|nr:hypothetical protein [Mycoplana sp. BE70]MDR6757995.1 hypothetical protein [Mycoplana sp. BE70]
MSAIAVFRRLYFLLALLGIVFAPVYAAAAAPAITGTFGAHQGVMPGMESGMDKDDCCRSELPAQTRDCGGLCPQALTCYSSAIACENSPNSLVRRVPRAVLHGPLRDDQRPSALVEPPTQPPKA